MPTLLHSRACSIAGVTYDVYLDRGDPGGTPVEITCRGLLRSYRPNSEDPDAALLASKLSATFLVTDQEQRDTLAQLATASELECCLRLERDGALEWAGFVLMDLVRVEFGRAKYDYTVVATDGLARLKKIDYAPGDITDFATYVQHLFQVFSELPLGRYYQPGDVFLSIHSTLWPDLLTPQAAVPQLDRIRMSVKALRTVDDKGEVKYRNFYEVLEELVRMLGARLTFARGRYWLIESVDYGRQGGVVDWQDYDISGQHLAGRSGDGWKDIMLELNLGGSTALAGGEMTYLPPLKEVVATYRHYSRQNLFPGSGLYSFNDRASVADFGTDGGNGTLAISGTLQLTVNESIPQWEDPERTVYVRILIRLRVLDEDGEAGVSFSRPSTISSVGYTYGEQSWSEDFRSDLCEIVVKVVPPVTGREVIQSFSFITPPVPRSGELELIFSRDGVYVDGQYEEFATFNFVANNVYVESLLEGSIADQYNETEFRIANESSQSNSATLDRTHLFGDGPSDNTFGRIECEVAPGQWQRTAGWRRWAYNAYLDRNHVGTLAHTALLAWMTLGLQRVQRERLDITVKAPSLGPHYVLIVGNYAYVCEDGEQNLLRDEWNGSWRAMAFLPPPPPLPAIRTEAPTITTDRFAPRLPPVGNLGGRGGIERGNTETENGSGELGVRRTTRNAIPTETAAPVIGIFNGERQPITRISLRRTPQELPIYRGQRLFLTDPVSGASKTVRARYDFDLGIETTADDPAATPYYEEDGQIKFLKQPGGELAVEDEDGQALVLPTGSYLQYEPAFVLRSVQALRSVPIVAIVAGFTEPLTLGYQEWFWHPTGLIGHELRGVTFTFIRNEAEVKINLKYFDQDAYRYTVATFEGTGTEGHVAVGGIIRGGFYRIELERITGPPPEGLQLTIDTVRRF